MLIQIFKIKTVFTVFTSLAMGLGLSDWEFCGKRAKFGNLHLK